MLNIQKNISLSRYTTFKIGGPAKYFYVVENIEEIRGVLEFAGKNKLSIFILGGGSNLLISDKGFGGIMMRIMNQELRIKDNKIFVGSGLSLAKLVGESVKNNLTGLEWAAGIPGTVGGAIVNNAGANNKSISDIVEKVKILEIGKLGNWEIGKLGNSDCRFSYRSSIFKEEKKYIIFSAILKLKKGNEAESKKITSEYLKSRKEKQPLEYPSAGSVFKNPEVDSEHLAKLIKRYPELKDIAKAKRCLTFPKEVKSLKVPKIVEIPAGWLIENLGLGGKKIGGAMISEKHCNFIVNTGNAKAEDVVILISLIKQKVRDNFGVQLKEEIEYVGF